MALLRVFALALLLAPVLSPAAPAFAQALLSSSAPTMKDVDPGVDHTGRDADLPSELRRQSVYLPHRNAAGHNHREHC